MEAIKRNVDYKAILYRNYNVSTIVLVVVMVSIYAFFFMSSLIFHETPVRTYTEPNSLLNIENGKMMVNSWIYSKDQQAFQICCTFIDYDNVNNLQVKSRVNFDYKTKGTAEIPCEVKYCDSNYIVVYAYNVPEDFYCSSLEFYYGEDTTISTVYTCVDSVENIDVINTNMTKDDYLFEKVERLIKYNQDSIEAKKADIEDLNESSEDYREQIDEVVDEMTFQVVSEKEVSQDKIDELRAKIEKNDERIFVLNEEIDLLESEIDEYQDILDKLK